MSGMGTGAVVCPQLAQPTLPSRPSRELTESVYIASAPPCQIKAIFKMRPLALEAYLELNTALSTDGFLIGPLAVELYSESYSETPFASLRLCHPVVVTY